MTVLYSRSLFRLLAGSELEPRQERASLKFSLIVGKTPYPVYIGDLESWAKLRTAGKISLLFLLIKLVNFCEWPSCVSDVFVIDY